MIKLIQCVVFSIVAVVSASSTAWGIDLTTYRWKSRLLFVFSPTTSEPRFAAFNQSVLKARLDLDERDLVVFRVVEKGASLVGERAITKEDAEKLRRRFNVQSGRFAVILTGKDGGVKMVREDRVDLQEIFDRIDSMPMRRQEMEERLARDPKSR
jgi:hypothetical protein